MTKNMDLNENDEREVLEEEADSFAGRCDLDLVLDIPLDVSVELGQVKMLVNDLLQLGQGSVVELSKAVGDPLEIYINNKLIAKGEVVVMDEKYGIRVTDIVSPSDRVRSLG